MTEQTQKRTQINLSGIVKHIKPFTTANGKNLVSVIISENVGGKDRDPEWVSYKLTVVGDAAQALTDLHANGGVPTKNDTQFAVLYAEGCKPSTQDVQAQNRTFENGQTVLDEKTFNTSVLSFMAFNTEVTVFTKGQSQGQQAPAAQQQSAPAQQQAPAQQSAPAPQPANNMDSFDDDIPF